MALIPVLISFVPLTTIKSADVNTNFSAIQTAFNASAVLTDVAKTVAVTHTWTSSQTFTGGFTTGAAVTLGAGLLFGTDNSFDIGASGANRPRALYVANGGTFGGNLSAAAATFSSALNVTGGGAAIVGATGITGTLNVSAAASFTANVVSGTGITVTTGGIHIAAGDLQADATIHVAGLSTLTGGATLGAGLTFGTDNSFDIGASGANRPRNLYVAGAGTFGGLVTVNNQLSLAPSGQTYALLSNGSTSVIGQLTNTNAAGFGLILKANNDANYTFTIINAANTLNTVHIYGDGKADFAGVGTFGGIILGGTLTFGTDNSFDIGASGANRPRNLYVAGTGTFGGPLSLGVNASAAYALAITQSSATGYGMFLRPGSDTLPGIRLSNAAGTANAVDMYGDGHAIFLGPVTVGALISNGNVVFGVDNAYTIGNVGSNRPATIYCAGTIFSASSRDLKQDIRPSHVDALSVVRRTRIVDFKYRANPDVDAIGFIAEDTHELLSGKSRKEFNINNTLGVLLKAVQELETQVSELKRKAA